MLAKIALWDIATTVAKDGRSFMKVAIETLLMVLRYIILPRSTKSLLQGGQYVFTGTIQAFCNAICMIANQMHGARLTTMV